MTDEEKLHRLLDARDERACLQKFLHTVNGGRFVVQIALNVPGLPKTMTGDAQALQSAERIFLRELGMSPAAQLYLRNYAGIAALFLFVSGDAVSAKKIAIGVEDETEWGRAFDIDVMTNGGQISRTELGEKARKCLLCEQSAKICARSGGHDITSLRREVLRLLSLAPRG